MFRADYQTQSLPTPFPSLDGLGPTRRTLHGYSQAIGIVPRAHGIADPRWWHISLKPSARGLRSDLVPLPNGHVVELALDLVDHRVKMRSSDGRNRHQPMDAGWSAQTMGEWLIEQAGELDLRGPFETGKLSPVALAAYEAPAVARFFQALRSAHRIFSELRSTAEGETGPIQLWPHGFDMSFETFGSRRVASESKGASSDQPAQLNLGFFPGDASTPAYFYSSPWPFEDGLTEHPLPGGATWNVGEWQGGKLSYADLEGRTDGATVLAEFARAVREIAWPTLQAG